MAPGRRFAVLLALVLSPLVGGCALIAGLPDYTLGTGGAGGAPEDGGADSGADGEG